MPNGEADENPYEHGVFIYCKNVYDENGELRTRYFATSPYVDPGFYGDPHNSIHLDESKVYAREESATIVAFIHTHPFEKKENVFSDMDVRAGKYDQYVVDNKGNVYILKYADIKSYGAYAIEHYEQLDWSAK